LNEKYDLLESLYVSELHPSAFADRWFQVCRAAMSKEIRPEDLNALLDLAIVSLRFEIARSRMPPKTVGARVMDALDLAKHFRLRRMRRTLEETEKEVMSLPAKQSMHY
jgi:hypothetical protein